MTRGAACPAGRLTCANVRDSKNPPPVSEDRRGAGTRGLPPYVFRPEAGRPPVNRSSCWRIYTGSAEHVVSTHPSQRREGNTMPTPRPNMPHPIDALTLTHPRGKLCRELLPGRRYRGVLVALRVLVDVAWDRPGTTPRLPRGPVAVEISVERLASRAGYSARWMRGALAELERVGLVVERAPGVVVLDGAELHRLAAAGLGER